MNWQDFLPQARALVEAAKQRYPGAEWATMGGGGGSDSSFARQGEGYHYRYYDTPAEISNLITQNARTAQIDPALASQQNAAYSSLMQETPENQPGYQQLSNVAAIDPTAYMGRDALEQVALRNPYSGDYEAETYDAFVQRAADALAGINSGPAMVRGGDARPAMAEGVASTRLAQERGKEVRDQQQADTGNVLAASLGGTQAETGRYGMVRDASLGLSSLGNSVADRVLGAARALDFSKLNNLQLLQLASSLQGVTTDKQVDDFSGRGDQSGWQAGLSCCFIVYAECRGKQLPWTLELARQEWWTPERRRGYNWMAHWLVPAMKRWSLVKQVVSIVLVRPAIRYCEWAYGGKPYNVLASAVSRTWLAVWTVLGKVVR